MSDDTSSQLTSTPASAAHGAAPDAFITIPADRRLAEPAAASALLCWKGEGRTIEYEATACHVDVREDTGNLLGKMFSLSYVAMGDGEPDASRPVTFCFNGGPGCASVPINFGGVGPRRVVTNGTSHVGRCVVEDNPCTLLVQSDLVFFDAPGTGFSSVAEGADTRKLFGVDGDADAFCRAIQQWLQDNGRWSSPVYLLGESYGTLRNAVLMRLLGERGVRVAGVTMLSAIFDWVQTLPGEDLYYLGMVPTFAATARHFGKAGTQAASDDEWFDQAMEFTDQVMAPALLAGDRLGQGREREVAERLSSFIGIDADWIARHHLRVDLDEFRARLLADEGRVIGRLDTRFSSDAYHPAQRSSDFLAAEDAADDAVESAWSAAFRTFLHDDLGYEAPARYLNNNYCKVGVNWNWEHEVPGTGERVAAPNVSFDIATALRRSPSTKLMIMGGRYDAATTYWNVVHDISCQFLSDDIKRNVTWCRYGCGHMAYVDVPTLEAMAADFERFYSQE